MRYVGIRGRGYVYCKTGKSKKGDDREVEMATAITRGNFAPNNLQMTQKSQLLNRMVGRNLWVPAQLGPKSSKGNKITNSYS